MADNQIHMDRTVSRELDEMMRLPALPVFNIKAVEQATDVQAATLRAWERRYSLLSPQRTNSGYRLYSERDVALVRWVKRQLTQGMTISHAVTLLAARLANTTEWHTPPTHPGSLGFAEVRDALFTAFLDLDEFEANHTLTDAFSRFPVEVVCLQVVEPALYAIGAGWARGEVSIAQEHFASHWVRQKILGLLAATPRHAYGRPLVTASAPTDQHELGILFIALFLSRAGWEVIHLGANLAADGLSETLSTLRPTLVAISATHAEAAAHVTGIDQEIQRMSEPRPILGFGGQIFNKDQELRAKTPGVFLGENAQAVVTTVDRLLRPLGR